MDINRSLRTVNDTNDRLVIEEDQQIDVLGLSAPGGIAQVNSLKAPLISAGKFYCSGDAYFIGPIKTPLILEKGFAFGDGSAGAPSIAFASDGSTGIFKDTNGAVAVTVGGNQNVEFAQTGAYFPGRITTYSGNLLLDPVGDIDMNGHSLINVGGITVTVGVPNDVIINSPTGVLTGEPQLSVSRGGTGTDTSAISGIPHVAAGTWTFSDIVDADVALGAAIARTKLAAGTPNQIIVNNNAGVLASIAEVQSFQGGTGIDTSASTGVAKVSTGTWSVSSIVNSDISASAAITRTKLATGPADYVVINDGAGAISSEQHLAGVRGGTGIDSTGANGVAKVTNGVWSISPIDTADIGPITNITTTSIDTTTINSTSGTTTFNVTMIQPAQALPGGATTYLTNNVQTSGATTANLLVFPTSPGPNSGTSYAITVQISFADITGGVRTGLMTFTIKVKNVGGVVTFSGKLLSAQSKDAGLASANSNAANSGSTFYIQVDGVAGMDIIWNGHFTIVAQEF